MSTKNEGVGTITLVLNMGVKSSIRQYVNSAFLLQNVKEIGITEWDHTRQWRIKARSQQARPIPSKFGSTMVYLCFVSHFVSKCFKIMLG